MALALGGCQTTDTRGGSPSYSAFYDRGDHLEALLDEGKLPQASRHYETEKAFFDASPAETSASVARLERALKADLGPRIAASQTALDALEAPLPRPQWAAAETSIETARAVLGEVESHALLQETGRGLPAAADLEARLTALEAALDEQLVALIGTADPRGMADTIAAFPTQDSLESLLNERPDLLLGSLAEASSAEISDLLASRPDMAEGAKTRLAGAYVGALLRERGDERASLRDVLEVVEAVEARDLTVGAIPGVRLAFADVTSPSLLKAGQIEFSPSVEVDLPFEVAKADVESALSAGAAENADFLVVFDVAMARVEREFGRAKSVPSQMQIGTQTVPNPKYNEALLAVQKAQNDLSAARTQGTVNSLTCYGFGCLFSGIASAIAQGAGADALQKAQTTLANTPTTIEQPIYRSYTVKETDVEAVKTMTVNYYVVDLRDNRYLKDTFDVTERRRFTVMYGVDANDKNRAAMLGRGASEKDVDDWEKRPVEVRLSQIADHYMASQERLRGPVRLAELQREMLADRNTAIARMQEETFTAAPRANDKRFDSVVAIYMPDGSLGTGFYVRPDLVMTNYHVVDEGEFVEMRFFDGRETFGKVVARDIRLDLALVRVQERGVPVAFHDSRQVDLGATVEVIGHPQGFEFSITRGVVSALREQPAPNRVGGKDVVQLQIDAATSPGNSGGPVFLGDRVVSVVSYGWAQDGSENLNFTIHHSEAERFLARTVPGA